MRQHRCGRFTVATSNTDGLSCCMVATKFNFRDHLDAFLTDCLHHRSLFWNPWGFDD